MRVNVHDGDRYRRLSELADILIDPVVGIVHYAAEQPREAGTPDLFHFAAQACRTDAFVQQRNFRSAGGAAIERPRALARAVGEAVERYAIALYDMNDFPVTTAADAPFACAEPSSFALYTEEEYGGEGFVFHPFTRDTSVRWVPAVDLRTGETVHVPAGAVFVPYVYYRRSGDTPVMQPNSSGLALHVSHAAAAATGLCEVLERDAFSIFWQAMLSPPRIDPATLSEANRGILARFRAARCEVALFDLSLDIGIPVVLAVQWSEQPGMPPITFAASGDPDPETAVRDALEELAHTMRYMHHIAEHVPRLPDEPGFRNVADQHTHLNFWCDPSRREAAAFVRAGTEVRRFQDLEDFSQGSPSERLRRLVDRVAERTGCRVLAVDVTSDDVRELGLSVVRIVVPGLHPLFWNHRYRARGGTRLWTVPQKLGYRGIDRAGGDNPLPHPYP